MLHGAVAPARRTRERGNRVRERDQRGREEKEKAGREAGHAGQRCSGGAASPADWLKQEKIFGSGAQASGWPGAENKGRDQVGGGMDPKKVAAGMRVMGHLPRN
ncbi:hypothetical protein TRIUR3_20973 [Triticum urartu]|uniref:Uncharacterized protein n=1 Tax=Triticum urartu TaxID=4572 RepID=M8B1E1_TRIUA|nr:hypothetical protein TRIUR3_20973 [Triticum urartu]